MDDDDSMDDWGSSKRNDSEREEAESGNDKKLPSEPSDKPVDENGRYDAQENTDNDIGSGRRSDSDSGGDGSGGDGVKSSPHREPSLV